MEDQIVMRVVSKIVAGIILLVVFAVLYFVRYWWKNKATTTQKEWASKVLLMLFGVPAALVVLTWVVELYAIIVYFAWNLIWPY